MAGARIDRLDLAAVALRRAGVEQQPVARERGRLVDLEHRTTAATQHDVAGTATASPVSSGCPARVHAPSPPSRIRTSSTPAQPSSHHARAADVPPLSS